MFENVEGFLTAGNGDRVFDLLVPLIQSGYRIHLRKVNASNYGVPQHRKRVIAIGGLGWEPTFPEPTHRAFGAPGTSNVFKHLPHSLTLADAIMGLPQPSDNPPGIPDGHYIRPPSEQDMERIQLLQPGQTMKNLPIEFWHNSYKRRAFRRVMDGTATERRSGAPAGLRRLFADQPSKAITSGAISEFVHPSENRFLTLRECARIQTFPDDFLFVGSISERILQIGNAVPPRLADVIARSLAEDLLSQNSATILCEGALLSFMPTFSSGKSPALERLCRRIEENYITKQTPKQAEQIRLWQ